MREAFLSGTDDCNWLRETHLRGVELPPAYAGFLAAVVQGNEDAPFAVNLYRMEQPNVRDDYLRVVFVHELREVGDETPQPYCRYLEFDGYTDQPKWHDVMREPLAYTEKSR